MFSRRRLPSLRCFLLYVFVSGIAAAMMLQFATARADDGPGVDLATVHVLESPTLQVLPLPDLSGRATRVSLSMDGTGEQRGLPASLNGPDPMRPLGEFARASMESRILRQESVVPPSPLPRNAVLGGGRNEEISVGTPIDMPSNLARQSLETAVEVPIPRGVVLFSYSL